MWNRQLQISPESAEWALARFAEASALGLDAFFAATGMHAEPLSAQVAPLRLLNLAEKLGADESPCACVHFATEDRLLGGVAFSEELATALGSLTDLEAAATALVGPSARALGHLEAGEATFVLDMATTAFREAATLHAKDYGVAIFDRLRAERGWILRYVLVSMESLEGAVGYREAA